jgi:hypothetical protein
MHTQAVKQHRDNEVIKYLQQKKNLSPSVNGHWVIWGIHINDLLKFLLTPENYANLRLRSWHTTTVRKINKQNGQSIMQA